VDCALRVGLLDDDVVLGVCFFLLQPVEQERSSFECTLSLLGAAGFEKLLELFVARVVGVVAVPAVCLLPGLDVALVHAGAR